MTVSQRSVFIGQDARLDTNPGSVNYFGAWTSDGATTSEVIQFTGPSTEPGLSDISTAAALPGSLIFAVGDDPSGPLFATDPVTGLPMELSVPALPTTDTPIDAISIGPVVLFVAQDRTGAFDLWRTDGTAAGTFALALPAGSVVMNGDNQPSLMAFDGGALFAGFGSGSDALFFTNGTSAGTYEVSPLPSIDGLGAFDPLGMLNGRLIFIGDDPTLGNDALFSTDGTTAGTIKLAEFFGVSEASSATLAGRIVYTTGSDLYVTDGTASGSIELPGLFNSEYGVEQSLSDLTPIGASAAFLVTTYGELGNGSSTQLDITDGTVAGTHSIDFVVAEGEPDLEPGITELTAFGSRLLFSDADAVSDSSSISSGLWVTDGTNAGTVEIAPSIDPSDITVLANGLAVFSGIGGLYVSDGTAAGTVEIAPGTYPSGITLLANGLAEFFGIGGLYVTDGTAAGTHLIAASGAPAEGLGPKELYAVPSPLGFSGAQTQYDLAPNAAGELQARDLVAGRDGSIVAPDARVLDFGDGSTAVFDATGNAEAVARLYLAAYDRAPDLAGLLSYTQQVDAGTVSLADIAAAAPTSVQFLSTYGALSNAQFVTQLYENADGRAPDPGGLAAYTGALADGQTRGQVLLAIAESPEARLHGVAVAGDADDATVTRLYEAINARAPDPGGQITYASALDNGQSVQQIAAAMLAGPEYAAEFGSPGNAAFVTDLYVNLLGRAPDPGGLASYTADLAGGQSRAQLVAGFVSSDEGRLVTAPLTHQGYVTVI